jgi:dCMP deaminase
MTRPTWPETWMAIARIIADRSYDPRLKVGAIIVSSDNTQMLSGGYNGNYAGGPHEHESPEPGLSGFIHAEMNALVKLDFNNPKEKHMFLTHSPCRMCAKLIINAGIKRVVYGEVYRDPSGVKLLQGVGVETMTLEDAVLWTHGEWGRTVRKIFEGLPFT